MAANPPPLNAVNDPKSVTETSTFPETCLNALSATDKIGMVAKTNKRIRNFEIFIVILILGRKDSEKTQIS